MNFSSSLPIFIAVLLLCTVSSCVRRSEATLIFCESFDTNDTPIGEGTAFSPGTISLLLETKNPIGLNTVEVHIFKLKGSERNRYGSKSVFVVNPSYSRFRLDNAVSFADTGTYFIRVTTHDAKMIVEGTIHIVASPEQD